MGFSFLTAIQALESQSDFKNTNISKINGDELTSHTSGLSETDFVVTRRVDRVRDLWSLGLVKSSNSLEDYSFNQNSFNFRSYP